MERTTHSMESASDEPALADLYPKFVPLLDREKVIALLGKHLTHRRDRSGDTLRNCDFYFRIPKKIGEMKLETFALLASVAMAIIEPEKAEAPLLDGESEVLNLIHWML